jgi:carbon monoxide dehydrogenase subunit G
VSERHFSFTDSWTVPAPPERVREVLIDLERYPEWWPQVRAVAKLDDDNARVLCRAALPYTLDLILTAVSRDLPTVRVDLDGPLAGWAAWTVTASEEGTRLDFEQEVDLVSVPAWLIAATRPLLVWNHHQMMRGAQRGLSALR